MLQTHAARRVRVTGLSKLVDCFTDDSKAILFWATFFKTMKREWQGIDRLRLDKFYNLICQFLKQGFVRVQVWLAWS